MITDPKKNAGKPIASANLDTNLGVLLDPNFLSTRLQASHFAQGGAVQGPGQDPAAVINNTVSKFRGLPLDVRMKIMDKVMQILVPEVAQGADQQQGQPPMQGQPQAAPAPQPPMGDAGSAMMANGGYLGSLGQTVLQKQQNGQQPMPNIAMPFMSQFDKKQPQPQGYAAGGPIAQPPQGNVPSAGPIPEAVKQNMPPEATADDVPAFLSKGEFVMDAATVSYFGVDKLVKMQEKAHQSLAEKFGGHPQQQQQMANGGPVKGVPRTPRVPQHHSVRPPHTTSVSPMADGGLLNKNY